MNIFVVNGAPGVGKTTFENAVRDILGQSKVFILSTIDPIKEMAKVIGWNGAKNDKDRKFLSDLKDLVTQYNDAPFKYIRSELRFINNLYRSYDIPSDEVIVFIDVREPQDIKRYCEELNAKSLLIRRYISPIETSNHADANVENYNYDIVIENYDDLTHFLTQAKEFITAVKNSAV